MTTYTFFTNPMSRGQIARWALHEAAADYDQVLVDWAAKPDALVMHPGPMNRGVEIDSEVADLAGRSLITRQVEMGVAIRMACLDILTRGARGVEGWA